MLYSSQHPPCLAEKGQRIILPSYIAFTGQGGYTRNGTVAALLLTLVVHPPFSPFFIPDLCLGYLLLHSNA